MAMRLSDLDDLLLAVRDPDSRRHLHEAVRCYRAGAYRSAVVGTWVAVVFDVFSKARELASTGDKQAIRYVAKLDRAISASDLPSLQRLESEVLEAAEKSFLLVSARESEDLQRLKKDRHACAHPAFVRDEALYQPSPEAARAHLVHVVTHLLRHAPTNGKAALTSFLSSAARPSFPSDELGIAHVLEDLLSKSRPGLDRNVAAACLKQYMRQTSTAMIGKEKRLLGILRVLRDRSPEPYRAAIGSVFTPMLPAASDDELIRCFGMLAIDPSLWDGLTAGVQTKLVGLVGEFLDSGDAELIRPLLQVAELEKPILEDVAQKSRVQRRKLLAGVPQRAWVPELMRLVKEACSWNEGQAIMEEAVLGMAGMLSPGEVGDLLRLVRTNTQVVIAGGTPAALADFYVATRHHLLETTPQWQSFLRDRIEATRHETSKYYAFPALQAHMEADQVWPVASATVPTCP